MARKMTEWPSKRGPITKIMPSDGCIGDTVPLAVGKCYDFHEFGWYMGNVGFDNRLLLHQIEPNIAVEYLQISVLMEVFDIASDIVKRAHQLMMRRPDEQFGPALELSLGLSDNRQD